MAKIHENELEIDEKIVRTLLKNQCPHWANLPLKAIISSGTDNALFRLGNEYVVCLPPTRELERACNVAAQESRRLRK
jgi:aminoglycoside phosphotransferase (APT) family kinase protein